MAPPAYLDEVAAYDYNLPRELIAQRPAEPRDHSRLMILNRRSGATKHRLFYNVVDYLRPGDLVVLNNTKVLPLRIRGTRNTGGMVEALLVSEMGNGMWEAFVKARGRLRAGERLEFENGRLTATLAFRTEKDLWALDFQDTGSLINRLEEFGRAPLPPYIRRPGVLDDELRENDRRQYQTVYASKPGAIAAPTAGLHFTPELLKTIHEKGVATTTVTLHVGLGTFRPIRSALVSQHKMEAEFFVCPLEAADLINATRRQGGRIVAVGSTCCRVLENVASAGTILQARGCTDLYIRHPFNFRLVDALITNFHLPKSTLLVLVCAFAGRDNVLRAYNEAIAMGYRFYSYGDAMLIHA